MSSRKTAGLLSLILLGGCMGAADGATPGDGGSDGRVLDSPSLDARQDAAMSDREGSDLGRTDAGIIVRPDAGPRPPVPDWVPEPGNWAAVSINTVADLDPCPSRDCSYSAIEGQSAVLDDWNGGAFAERYGTLGGLVVFGGGHNGYFGNEIYVWDAESRRWVRETDPVEDPRCDQSTGELQDGSPCSAHTYGYVNYHPATNSFMEITSASNHEFGGGGAPYVHAYSFDTGEWRRGAAKPSFNSGTGATTAFDPNRGEAGVFWYVPTYYRQLGYYDPIGDEWTEFELFNIDIDHMTAIDPERDVMAIVDARGTNQLRVVELSDPDAHFVGETTGDTAPMSVSKLGFAFHPPSGKFVAWIGGARVFTLTPPEGDLRVGNWVWEEVPGGGETPDGPNANGTYNRWVWAPTLDAFLVVSHVDSAVYAYRANF